MLQYGTVGPGTLDILRKLMAVPELRDFYLVGGTALALYRAHRISVDLDLFTTREFQPGDIIQALEKNFHYNIYCNNNNTDWRFC